VLVGRDRALAWFLALQLLIAAVFGGVLVHALRNPQKQTLVVQPGGVAPVVDGSTPTPSPGAVATPGAATTTTTTIGGTKGSAGTQGTQGSTGTTAATGSTGASGSNPGVKAGATLTFGSIVTQNFSISFRDSKAGTQAYLAQVNAKGGANGHKLNMIYNDDQGSSQTGYKQAQSLINQNVLAFAAFNAPITEGYGPFKALLDDNKIPLIGSYGESLEYKDQYAFAFTANYVHFGYEIGKFLVEKGSKKPAFMYIDNTPDTVANDEIERGFKAGVTAAGGNGGAAVFDKVSTTQATFDNDLSQFQVAGVDGFGSILDNTGYGRLLQAQARANYYPTHVATPLFDLDSVKSQAHTDQHPVYVASDIDFLETGGPAVQEYVRAIKAQGGTPSYLGSAGWLDAIYLVQAVSKLGTSFTRADLLTAMNSLGSYDNGFTHQLSISPGFHDMNKCIKFGRISSKVLTQVQDWTCDTQQP
jgi:ABC-type branched-subunit amino acid transport system substrate-binding protein